MRKFVGAVKKRFNFLIFFIFIESDERFFTFIYIGFFSLILIFLVKLVLYMPVKQ